LNRENYRPPRSRATCRTRRWRAAYQTAHALFHITCPRSTNTKSAGHRSASVVGRTQAPECNEAMARNATAQGVPWGVIEGLGTYTKPSSMLYLGAEDAECWDLMCWNGSDTGIACFKWSISERPAQVTAKKCKRRAMRVVGRPVSSQCLLRSAGPRHG
jgi:hypothetical protein